MVKQGYVVVCVVLGFHRLDRLTSGLVVFTRTEDKAREMGKLIRERKVEKEYLARVTGCFPRWVINNELLQTLHEMKETTLMTKYR